MVQDELKNTSPLKGGFNNQAPKNQYLADIDNLHSILDSKIKQLITLEPTNKEIKTKFVITELKNMGNYLTSKTGLEPFEVNTSSSGDNDITFSQLKEDFGLFKESDTPNWDYQNHVGEFEYLSGVKEFGFFYDGDSISAGLHESNRQLVPRNTADSTANGVQEQLNYMSFKPGTLLEPEDSQL